jgi:hypothetical protein
VIELWHDRPKTYLKVHRRADSPQRGLRIDRRGALRASDVSACRLGRLHLVGRFCREKHCRFLERPIEALCCGVCVPEDKWGVKDRILRQFSTVFHPRAAEYSPNFVSRHP